MKYSFDDGEWKELAYWIKWFFKFGYDAYSRKCNEKQYIYIIITPEESVCPLLVALGAMRKDVENEFSSDICKHFERIKKHPEKILIHNRSKYRFIFKYYDKNDDLVCYESMNEGKDGTMPEIRKISIKSCIYYHFENEHAILTNNNQNRKYDNIDNAIAILNELLPDADKSIIKDNFSIKHSAIWVAGTRKGEEFSKKQALNMRFRKTEDDPVLNLSELSFIEGWSGHHISRIQYYNLRKEEKNYDCSGASLMITENADAFLSFVDREEFSNTDFVCFFPIVSDLEEIENFKDKINSLMQWYDLSNFSYLDNAPNGISVFVLERRGI